MKRNTKLQLSMLDWHAIYLLTQNELGSKRLRDFLDKNRGNPNYHATLPDRLKDELENLKKEIAKQGVEIVSDQSDEFPECLKHLSDCPNYLFIKGDKTLLKRRLITVVGTRNISPYGRAIVNGLLGFNSLANTPVVIVSGLAYGVDSLAHSISLKRKVSTIAVVAGGIDKGYPVGNENLYQSISNEGCVIAEYPPGKSIVKGMFPMRNRIMASMSDITVVVEAGEKSGSLITAHLALEQGKDVYVFPGDITRPGSLGCNKLISMGATPVINFRQFWRDINVDIDQIESNTLVNANTEAAVDHDFDKIIKMVRENNELSLDRLSFLTGLKPTHLNLLLTNLEIEGILRRNESGNYTYYY